MGALPLAGTRVLDLSRVLAGPYCCALMGELGADVIKVERPGKGDENRKWGKLWHGESLDFSNVNRNKRDITVNLQHEQGREVIRRLAAKADVVVESFTPGTMEELGLGWEDLRKLNDRLIYLSLSAFGDRGPLRERPGYDGALQAFSGHMSITGEMDGGPVRSGASMIDMGTGITAFGAVMTALLGREKGGGGQKVSVSLLQTAIALMGAHAAVYLMSGHQPTRAGSGVSHLAPYGAFQTKDSWVVCGALNQDSWKKLCGVLGCEALVTDPRFAELPDRVARRIELNGILTEIFCTRTTADWTTSFEAAGMVIAPVNTLAEVMEHPQVAANNLIVGVDHPAGEMKLVGAPMLFGDWDLKPRAKAPALGEHTDAILGEIGYDAAAIAALRAAGAV